MFMRPPPTSVLRIGHQRAQKLDSIALRKEGFGAYALAEDGISEHRRLELEPADQTGGGDGVRDGGARRDRDVDLRLGVRLCVRDDDVHGHTCRYRRDPYTDSARRTNASTNVLAM